MKHICLDKVTCFFRSIQYRMYAGNNAHQYVYSSTTSESEIKLFCAADSLMQLFSEIIVFDNT